MEYSESSIEEIFGEKKRMAILAGAGCSIAPPSNLPSSTHMKKELIRFFSPTMEDTSLFSLQSLRFENILEIIRRVFDPDLKLLNYFTLCNSPNLYHYCLADLISKGNYVLTPNFDCLIESALKEFQLDLNSIVPVISKQDYLKLQSNIKSLQNNCLYLFKLHGSPKNIITNEELKSDLISIIEKVGVLNQEFDLTVLEPYKGFLFREVLNDINLIILGYSGENDFDILPALKKMEGLNNLIWVQHEENGDGKTHMEEVVLRDYQTLEEIENVDRILLDLKSNHPDSNIFKIRGNSLQILQRFTHFQLPQSSEPFSIDFKEWLVENYPQPTDFIKFLISHIINFNSDKIEDSLRCGLEALKLFSPDENISKKLIILNNLGWIYFSKRKYAQSKQYFKEALDIAIEKKDITQQIIFSNNLGEILEREGDLKNALENYQHVLNIVDEVDHPSEKLRALNGIIAIHEKNLKYTEAQEHYKKALRIAKKSKDPQKEALYLNNLASIYTKLEEFDLAKDLYLKSEKIYRDLQDLEKLAINLNNQGVLYQKQRNYEIALEKYNDALEIDEDLKNISGKAWRLNKIGTVHLELDQYPKAIEFFKKAQTIAERAMNFVLVMEFSNNLGKAHYFLKNYEAALKAFKYALYIAENSNNIEMNADYLNNIAGCYYMQLKYKESLVYAERAVKILEELGQGKSVKAMTLNRRISKIKNQILL